MDKKKIERQLEVYIDRLQRTVHPDRVILYGSFARGSATEWSDIDVMVIAPFKRISHKKRFDILYDLHTDIESDHDFHVYGMTPEEYKKASPLTIIEEVKKEGVTVFP